MLFQANIASPVPGQLDNFNSFLLKNLELAGACGVPATVKVSSYGTPSIEIMTLMMFSGWEEHGAKTAEMRAHPMWKKLMEMGGNMPAFADPIDSFVASILPGFDTEAKFSEGPILTTVWKPTPGKMSDMLATFHEAKAVHEPHGCMVRAFQIIGGRYAGCTTYNMSFADDVAYGKCMGSMQADHAELVSKIEANPNSEMVAQFKMNNPTIVG